MSDIAEPGPRITWRHRAARVFLDASRPKKVVVIAVAVILALMAYGLTWNLVDKVHANHYLSAIEDAQGHKLDSGMRWAYLELRDKTCQAMRDNHIAQNPDNARQIALNSGLSRSEADTFAAGIQGGGCIG